MTVLAPEFTSEFWEGRSENDPNLFKALRTFMAGKQIVEVVAAEQAQTLATEGVLAETAA